MSPPTTEFALQLQGIGQSFPDGSGGRLRVLEDVSLELGMGTCAGLVGASGAGKSTLLHIAGLLEKPESGVILIAGKATEKLSSDGRARLRGQKIGFVYQFHNLLPDFTALENVMMPLLLTGTAERQAREKAAGVLDSMGLSSRLRAYPNTLSGGEQQRVAIARALAAEPALLLADEPTGNLDPATADRVFEELLGLVRSRRMAALIVTHNPALALRMDAVYRLQDRKVFRE
jgi:lipoprotein-releasing system ATP-binding protein